MINHFLNHRGESFRTEFLRLGEVRSILPHSVHMMALTATASATLRRSVTTTLGMHNIALIEVSPELISSTQCLHFLQSRNLSCLLFVILPDKS